MILVSHEEKNHCGFLGKIIFFSCVVLVDQAPIEGKRKRIPRDGGVEQNGEVKT